MQSHVPQAVLEVLPRLRAGSPWVWRRALTVVPLVDIQSGAGGREVAAADTPLIFFEQKPPQPGAVVARSAAGNDVVVWAGEVLDGGMAARVVRRTTVVPASGAANVPVEVVEARWYGRDEGLLQHTGRVAPPLVALLGHLTSRSEPDAAMSRMALWSATSEAEAVNAEARGSELVNGWAVLGQDGDILAAVVGSGLRPIARPLAVTQRLVVTSVRRVGDVPRQVNAAIGGLLAEAVVVAHDAGPDVLEVAALGRARELVDAIVAATIQVETAEPV